MTLAEMGAWSLIQTGELRELLALPPAVVVSAEGQTPEQSWSLDQRLRAGLSVGSAELRIGTEWDLFTGHLAADPWALGSLDERHRDEVGVLGAHAFVPRKLALEGRAGPLMFSAGLQTSHWGLGMLANDGAQSPTFGRADFGDRVARVRLATKPAGLDSPLAVFVAADRVIADENASTAADQVAWQGVAGALWAEPNRRAGVYAVYRDQLEADRVRRTRVGVLDLTGELSHEIAHHELHLGLEAAGTMGTTSRVRTYNSPEQLDVLSAGVVGYAGVTRSIVDGRLRFGWASGDGDPDDGATHDFGFDRDHDAGMVLFDELGGATDAWTAEELQDPENVGQPPDGYDGLATEGAVRRAAYVQPVVTVTPTPGLTLRAGWMGAWATAPVANPFTSARNGGTPTNALGEATEGRALGQELDWSVEVQAEAREGVVPSLRVQGGHLFASENLGGGTWSLLLVQGGVRW